MAEFNDKRASTARLTRNVSKLAFRGKEKMLRSLGVGEETKDEIIDNYVHLVSKQQVQFTKFQRDMKTYLQSITVMRHAAENYYSSLNEVYEDAWMGKDMLSSLAKTTDMLYGDLQSRLQQEVITALQNHLVQCGEMKVKVQKRGRKLVDFDAARRNLHAIESTKKPEASKVTKAREQVQQTHETYETMNSQLHQELPDLHDSRVALTTDVISSIATAENKFFEELADIRGKLLHVVNNVQDAFNGGEYRIQRLHSPSVTSGHTRSSTLPAGDMIASNENQRFGYEQRSGSERELPVEPLRKRRSYTKDAVKKNDYVNIEIGNQPRLEDAEPNQTEQHDQGDETYYTPVEKEKQGDERPEPPPPVHPRVVEAAKPSPRPRAATQTSAESEEINENPEVPTTSVPLPKQRTVLPSEDSQKVQLRGSAAERSQDFRSELQRDTSSKSEREMPEPENKRMSWGGSGTFGKFMTTLTRSSKNKPETLEEVPKKQKEISEEVTKKQKGGLFKLKKKKKDKGNLDKDTVPMQLPNAPAELPHGEPTKEIRFETMKSVTPRGDDDTLKGNLAEKDQENGESRSFADEETATEVPAHSDYQTGAEVSDPSRQIGAVEKFQDHIPEATVADETENAIEEASSDVEPLNGAAADDADRFRQPSRNHDAYPGLPVTVQSNSQYIQDQAPINLSVHQSEPHDVENDTSIVADDHHAMKEPSLSPCELGKEASLAINEDAWQQPLDVDSLEETSSKGEAFDEEMIDDYHARAESIADEATLNEDVADHVGKSSSDMENHFGDNFLDSAQFEELQQSKEGVVTCSGASVPPENHAHDSEDDPDDQQVLKEDDDIYDFASNVNADKQLNSDFREPSQEQSAFSDLDSLTPKNVTKIVADDESASEQSFGQKEKLFRADFESGDESNEKHCAALQVAANTDSQKDDLIVEEEYESMTFQPSATRPAVESDESNNSLGKEDDESISPHPLASGVTYESSPEYPKVSENAEEKQEDDSDDDQELYLDMNHVGGKGAYVENATYSDEGLYDNIQTLDSDEDEQPIYEEPPFGDDVTPSNHQPKAKGIDTDKAPAVPHKEILPPHFLYKAVALFPYKGADDDELSFTKGDVIYVVEFPDPEEQTLDLISLMGRSPTRKDEGWQMGVLRSSWEDTGSISGMAVFPENFTKKC